MTRAQGGTVASAQQNQSFQLTSARHACWAAVEMQLCSYQLIRKSHCRAHGYQSISKEQGQGPTWGATSSMASAGTSARMTMSSTTGRGAKL